MKKLTASLLSVALLCACQKEISPNDPNNPGGTGGSTSAKADYQPVSAGSVWNMKSSSIGDYTLKTYGTDTTINGKKFFKIDHSVGGRQYVNKDNGVYTQMALSPQTGGWITMLYLKDAPAATTWSETLSNSQGQSVNMAYTVASVGGTRKVNGKTYDNVLKLTYEQSAMGMTTAVGEQYFAKGVGPIEATSRMSMMGMSMLLDSTYLVSATIK